jgi:hypothetical protein
LRPGCGGAAIIHASGRIQAFDGYDHRKGLDLAGDAAPGYAPTLSPVQRHHANGGRQQRSRNWVKHSRGAPLEELGGILFETPSRDCSPNSFSLLIDRCDLFNRFDPRSAIAAFVYVRMEKVLSDHPIVVALTVVVPASVDLPCDFQDRIFEQGALDLEVPEGAPMKRLLVPRLIYFLACEHD